MVTKGNNLDQLIYVKGDCKMADKNKEKNFSDISRESIELIKEIEQKFDEGKDKNKVKPSYKTKRKLP